MAESKPKPYSKRKAKPKALKGDDEVKNTISPELKPKKEEPSPEPKMKTKGGKEWGFSREVFGVRIQFSTGGEVPKQLSGLYTSEAKAKEAIKVYEAKRG